MGLLRSASVVGLLLLVVGCSDYGQRPFDQKLWLSAEPALDRTRAEMISDLRSRYRLGERTKGELIQLLGPPNSRQVGQGWQMQYALGPEGWDTLWLSFKFDESGHVVRHALVSD